MRGVDCGCIAYRTRQPGIFTSVEDYWIPELCRWLAYVQRTCKLLESYDNLDYYVFSVLEGISLKRKRSDHLATPDFKKSSSLPDYYALSVLEAIYMKRRRSDHLATPDFKKLYSLPDYDTKVEDFCYIFHAFQDIFPKPRDAIIHIDPSKDRHAVPH
ncbi:hypothetical protein G7Z17_g8016 [Cylindrodendrum hubeiense]|uniref:Uncharacterized protein n=1 Tax=Cylindrodendrum hubeiense TaxID=595255 RepID=A0A9P5LDL0_9HYPO|nr:hypothetical protein G7Z17_g8016 [Cylindrodendrum hubeiense]